MTIAAEQDEEVCREVLQILSRIGDKWSLVVIGHLTDRTLRFGELQREITGISQRMLTLTLRQLEREGLVTRTVYPSVPPRVEYALTDLGDTLIEPVRLLGRWATDNRLRIKDNRRRYDEEHP